MIQKNQVCDFGWKAPEFKLSTPDGINHTMSSHLGNGLLIAFICNHCPYVKAIAHNLAADARELRTKGIGVLAVMSNDYHSYPTDSPDQMRAFAAYYEFDFPYLVDEDQAVAQAYGAVCTPDFFGLNSNGELQYRGRFDDARMEDPSHRIPELRNAMLQISETGEGPRKQIPSMGCSIKWR